MRSGWTKTEAVIVLAIIALVAVNLPPMIVWAREAARRQQCVANLRAIGTALTSYADVHRTFPPAALWSAEGLDLKNFFKDGRPISVTRQNWAQLLLPHLDEEALAAKFRPDLPVTHPDNGSARMTALPRFRCASDDYHRADNPYVLELPKGKSQADATECRFARGNYAINGGSQFWGRWPGYMSNPRANASHIEFDPATRDFQFFGCGVAGINTCYAPDDFTNGLASTVAVDEVRSGIHAVDSRGVWALGQIGSSITWGHGITGDAGHPNSKIKDADDIVGCKKLHELLGPERIRTENMPCCDHCAQNQQAGARSRHPGGVHVLLLDGAVRFVSENVDAGLWQVLHSRETPADLLRGGFEQFLDGSPPAVNDAPRSDSAAVGTNLTAGETATNSIGMTFVVVPAGEFSMGLPNERNPFPTLTEAPAHRVRITRPYLLGVHEVTQEQYERVMGKNPSWFSSTGGGRETVLGSDTSRFPVEQVSWHDAAEFCGRLTALPEERAAGRSYRLPTEAEWERACRAGRETSYPLPPERLEPRADTPPGEEPRRPKSKYDRYPEPAGSQPANPYGLCDMTGNVFEWTNDWYARDYYSRSPVDDPQGPADGYLKVVRGWHWVFTGDSCKDNLATECSSRSRFIGFRVICNPKRALSEELTSNVAPPNGGSRRAPETLRNRNSAPR